MQKKKAAGADTWADPDDAPELTAEHFKRADVYMGTKLVSAGRRPGRPRSANPKEAIKLRLSPQVLAFFRASGRGWQTRINETLERVVNGQLAVDRATRPTRSAAAKRK
jgi:uncharacterized protein (DUF4415 family)